MKIYFYMFILHITATMLTAMPTGFVGSDRSSDHNRELSFSTSAITVSSEHKLANIGKRFLQPHATISGTKKTTQPVSKALPNAPAAILLGIIGFLCVTGVKNRKEWLAGFANILCLRQAGITALPKLIPYHHVEKPAKLLSSLGKVNAYLFKKSSRLRLEVEGYKYISLLRQLSSIPDHQINATSNINMSQPEILYTQNTINNSPHRSTAQTGQLNCFLLAFISSNLSRGPPSIA